MVTLITTPCSKIRFAGRKKRQKIGWKWRDDSLAWCIHSSERLQREKKNDSITEMLVYFCKFCKSSGYLNKNQHAVFLENSSVAESSLNATFSRNQRWSRALNELHTNPQLSTRPGPTLPPVLVVWLVSLLGFNQF